MLPRAELKQYENKEDEYIAAFGQGFGQYILKRHEMELKNKNPDPLFPIANTNIADMKRYLSHIIDHPPTFQSHCKSGYAVSEELIEPMRKTLLKERLLRELRAPVDAKIDEPSTKDLNASTSSSSSLPILKPRLVLFRKSKNVDEKKEQSCERSEEKCYKTFGLFQRKNGARIEVATYKVNNTI